VLKRAATAPPWALATIGVGLKMREARFLLLVALSVAWSWQPLTTVIERSLKSGEYEHYSYIILMPFISAYLLYLNRHAILEHVHPGLRAGILPAAAGAATIWLAGTTVIAGEAEYRLSLAMLGLVTLWAGGFVLCYGLRAFRIAAFPFLLLLFMIPFPPAMLSAVITFLQGASADASDLLFRLIGIPAFREGFVFSLPGLTIRVAEECSGIRSCLSLVITGLVMAYLFLRSTWTRLAFVLVIVPLAIVKNAIRIVGLSWLAIHVDPSFITGSALHRNSGIPVFFLSLAVLGAAAWVLRRGEARFGAARARESRGRVSSADTMI
jgi:exosortase